MSSLSIGIVGFPNVGKSTLFNALLKQQQALAANYPFATIEPNVGIVPVPDERLSVLAEIAGTSVIKPATVEFVDIAGLVKGASKGEGLGNQFLANIRETNAIVHVLRAFEDENVLREGATEPKSDLETIRLELQLADLTTLEKQKAPKGKVSPEMIERWEMIQAMKGWLEQEQTIVSRIPESKFEIAKLEKLAKELGLLTAKPEIYALNVSEDTLQRGVEELTKSYATQLGVEESAVVVMSAKIESELSSLDEEDQKLYLDDLGLAESGLGRLIKVAYKTLRLQSYLTAGEIEVHAWTIKQGSTAPQAAGVIHTDFQKKFIKAHVASFKDFVEFNGWKGLKVVGKVRQEGKDYIMQDGDVVEFAIGA